MREWNAAMDHIEAHLRENITGEELARIALTSEYHFRRMFATLAGMPLSVYIRRRRLTAAAADLISGRSVLDTAIAYGYGSADAFARAFKAMHGINPTQARSAGSVLHSQSQLTFHMRIEGSADVQYRIEHKNEFRLVGFRTQVPVIHLGRNETMEQFERGIDAAAAGRLEDISNVAPRGTLGVTAYLDGRDDEVEYWHAVATTVEPPEGFDTVEVPAGKWVVLSAEGAFPEAMQQLWASAATEWFPANPYRWAPGPQMLSVTADKTGDSGRGELWIPIEPE
jgi:AraC family transcriptional regulator